MCREREKERQKERESEREKERKKSVRERGRVSGKKIEREGGGKKLRERVRGKSEKDWERVSV